MAIRDPKKEAEVLKRARENDEDLRIEWNGKVLLTISLKAGPSALRLLTEDQEELVMASRLLAEACQESENSFRLAHERLAVLNLALGAIVSHVKWDEEPKTAAMEKSGTLTFTQAPPKGKAS